MGSSAKSSFGPQARAMAMVTRWRMPPESWWGYSLEALLGLGDADRLEQGQGGLAGLALVHVEVVDAATR